MDYGNNYLVSATPGGTITILNPPLVGMSPDEALVLAAWLVAMAQFKSARTFAAILEEVLEA
jgi:hypothetical protein